jgi:hypothetical protein
VTLVQRQRGAILEEDLADFKPANAQIAKLTNTAYQLLGDDHGDQLRGLIYTTANPDRVVGHSLVIICKLNGDMNAAKLGIYHEQIHKVLQKTLI